MNRQTTRNHRLPDALCDQLEAGEQAELEKVWAVLEEARPGPEVASSDVEDRLHHVKQRMATTPSRRHRTDRPQVRRSRTGTRAFRWVGLAVLIVAGVLWYVQQPVVMHASEGGLLTATLPDGSTVELNSGSTLSYPRQFSILPGWQKDEREVYLKGEAFFDVAHEGRPFIVETFNATVEVLGTAFNVRAWEEDVQRSTTVTLASGKVRLLAKQEGASPVLLTDGEVSRVEAEAVAPTAPEVATLERALVWRSRGFAFSNQELRSVFEDLERRYAVTVRADDETIAQLRTTAYYPAPKGIEAILEDLSATNALAYRSTPTGYEVYRPQR